MQYDYNRFKKHRIGEIIKVYQTFNKMHSFVNVKNPDKLKIKT